MEISWVALDVRYNIRKTCVRVLKNIYFWWVLGTVAFIWASAAHSGHHFTRQEVEDCEVDNNLSTSDYPRDCTPPSGFERGFMTAVVAGGFWVAVALLAKERARG